MKPIIITALFLLSLYLLWQVADKPFKSVAGCPPCIISDYPTGKGYIIEVDDSGVLIAN